LCLNTLDELTKFSFVYMSQYFCQWVKNQNVFGSVPSVCIACNGTAWQCGGSPWFVCP